ncbi:hypothetical protein EGW08_022449 [Elysia chlorotica]|uniref:Uncharacterized protein n=1 Tax=Elysia chlorotica TaxID=188477 RepID=A0A433SKY9_ELYCH|nr:hypothetical protein EGW08_022449 [Elysia chlorotica]
MIGFYKYTMKEKGKGEEHEIVLEEQDVEKTGPPCMSIQSPTQRDSDIVGKDGPAADSTTRNSTSRHPSADQQHSTGTPDTTDTAEFFWDEENDEPNTAICDTDTASPPFLRKSNTFTPNTGRDSAWINLSCWKLDPDSINGHIKEISNTSDKGVRDREIDAETGKALLVPHPIPGRFYILPKIHKEGNPGRHIISGNGSPTEIISQFVDCHMKDLVKQLPSYVQDDMDFLRKIGRSQRVRPPPSRYPPVNNGCQRIVH